ncbi:hypothetical protein DYB37_008255 [Aphanomyces astaci]|uniref:Major facilitator superfamily (MFS) profile domain-containing protein n=1 Tax=Aphanomyces astaci TaxID=112090 RepID=A0A418DTY9_APHAT|nr:hypothetical protein DYB35_011869 [Aphanomyces astaci]RHZ18863.1 hypothetical protein DYB37_008255 [Aphanomyces astaci]
MEKAASAKRWVLVLSSLLVVGLNYCYDNPGAMKSQLQQHFHRIPKTKYELLFVRVLYSVPNMVLPLFGGILIDRVGVQTMTMVVVSLVLAGQVIVALGSAMHNFNLILVQALVPCRVYILD